ncbi:NUDIX hydrolase [Candidatus Bathyarchaeota archaeon]|nr:NUDIX hydrolase [Candidatus Bathyarchaeota archaeon]
MKVIYAGEALPPTFSKSIFLAGPTPRKDTVQSWRPEALAILELLGYDGVVYVPEYRPGSDLEWNSKVGKDNILLNFAHNEQIQWETTCLEMSDCIVFWVPRELGTMPALTTNDEWGTWKKTGKVVFGCPPTAPKTRYQKHFAEKLSVPTADTLAGTLKNAVDMVSQGAERTKGERNIPLMIWNTKAFQSWYDSHKTVGNYLDGAKVLWSFRAGPNKKFVFAYTIHVKVYVADEDRCKVNEFVFFRTDISCVVLYHKASNLRESEVVLIKEFRSPVRNEDGFVYEVAGGSSFKEGQDPVQVASDEVFEETGIRIAPGRFRCFKSRQIAATVSSHHAYMYAAEITEEELAYAKKAEAENKMFGNNVTDSEQTYVRVVTIDDVLEHRVPIDWSMVGMILRAIV